MIAKITTDSESEYWSVTDGDVNVAARHRSLRCTIFTFAAVVEKTPTAT
ncbi:MAG TPA: hypothetical protein VF840_07490 [Terriglobales bacterium]